MIPILPGERSLGALLAADVILLVGQLFLPFIFAFFDLIHCRPPVIAPKT
jgi:hypothetical protein